MFQSQQMDELMEEACASTPVSPRKQIRSENRISPSSSQINSQASMLPSNSRAVSRVSTGSANILRNLIITYRREVEKLKKEINNLTNKLDSGGLTNCPSCNHKFRYRDNLFLPKYIKVLRGRFMLEMEFSSIDSLEEWLTLNNLEEAAGGFATIRKTESAATLKSCDSQLQNLLKEELTKKQKVRIPLSSRPNTLQKENEHNDTVISERSEISKRISLNEVAQTYNSHARTDEKPRNKGESLSEVYSLRKEKEILRRSPPLPVVVKNAVENTYKKPNLHPIVHEEPPPLVKPCEETRSIIKEDISKRSPRIVTLLRNSEETTSREPSHAKATSVENVAAKEGQPVRKEALLNSSPRISVKQGSTEEISRKANLHQKTDGEVHVPYVSHSGGSISRTEEMLRRSPRKSTRLSTKEMEIKARIDLIVEQRKNLTRDVTICDRNNRNRNNNRGARGAPNDSKVGRNDHLQSRSDSRNPRSEAAKRAEENRRRHDVSRSEHSDKRNRNPRGRNVRPELDSRRSSTRMSDRLATRSPLKRKAISPVSTYSNKRVRENSRDSNEKSRFRNDKYIELDSRRNNSDSRSRRRSKSRSRHTSERRISITSVDNPHTAIEELIEVDATDFGVPDNTISPKLSMSNVHPSSTPSSAFSVPTSVTSRLVIAEEWEDGEVFTDEDDFGDQMNTTPNRTLTTPNHDQLISPVITLGKSADSNVSTKAIPVQSEIQLFNDADKEASMESQSCEKKDQCSSSFAAELEATSVNLTSANEPEQGHISQILSDENVVSAKSDPLLPPSTDEHLMAESQTDYQNNANDYDLTNSIKQHQSPSTSTSYRSQSVENSSSSSDESESSDHKTSSNDDNDDKDEVAGTDDVTAAHPPSSEESSQSDSDCFGAIAVDNDDDIFSDSFEPKSSDSEHSDFFKDSDNDDSD